MDHYEPIHNEIRGGYQIVFSAMPETVQPDLDYEDEDDRQATLARIDRGDLVHFVARVQAYRYGVLLASDYLGGCCYDSHQQFIDSSGYYPDMVDTVISDANDMVQLLQVKP
jgi:hypothetical protein